MDITHLIEPEIICLDLKANNKEDVLIELVELLDNAGKLTDKQQFLNDIWRREEIGNTGLKKELPFHTPKVLRWRCLQSSWVLAAKG